MFKEWQTFVNIKERKRQDIARSKDISVGSISVPEGKCDQINVLTDP